MIIKAFVWSLIWIAASVTATTIWVRYILSKHAESVGRDPEYLEFEVGQQAMSDVTETCDNFTNLDAEERKMTIIGYSIALLMVLLWPVTTPIMLWVGGKHSDTICNIFGWDE
jgi:hypothetical protein